LVLSRSSGRPPAGTGLNLLGALLVLGLAGCAAPAPPSVPVAGGSPAVSTAAETAAPSARVGGPAASSRIRFVPTTVELPDGARAPVRPAETVAGRLVVPEKVQQVGWWDGSAWAGDPYGATVVAGHVDSATEGLGFFARLLRVEPGETVTLRDGENRQRYRIVSVRTVSQQSLATSSAAFDQTGAHRLVLITCTGDYRPERRGYDANLVVTATAVGPAR
jgi:LPXTG-site transpeptidase (sortase) family protein